MGATCSSVREVAWANRGAASPQALRVRVSGSPPFDHTVRVRASWSPPFDHRLGFALGFVGLTQPLLAGHAYRPFQRKNVAQAPGGTPELVFGRKICQVLKTLTAGACPSRTAATLAHLSQKHHVSRWQAPSSWGLGEKSAQSAKPKPRAPALLAQPQHSPASAETFTLADGGHTRARVWARNRLIQGNPNHGCLPGRTPVNVYPTCCTAIIAPFGRNTLAGHAGG